MPAGAGVLEPILAAKKRELQATAVLPAHSLQPATHRFKQALKRSAGQRLRVIAECKKASPSRGLLRADYRPGQIADEYLGCGAAAISVLTDLDFFQGQLSDIEEAGKSGLPVLRKDFIIDERQISQARQAGAEAVLLIARILTDNELSRLYRYSRTLGMDVLLEIHDQEEMERALALGADIIGINHRNLDTLEMNLALTPELAPLARRAYSDLILVAESGLENPAGRKLVDPHVDAVLVGTAFMESNNIGQTWVEIFG